MPTYDPFHYPYKTQFEPARQIGDFVELMRMSGDAIDMRIEYIEPLALLGEFNVIQTGTVINGATSSITKALISGADIIQSGPDEFYQLRFGLNPTDWAAVSTADIKLNLYQPGPGQSRWAGALAVGAWDMTGQNYWTSLHPTETFSWWTDTPQFSVTNNSGATISNARVRVWAWRFAGEVMKRADMKPEDIVGSPSGILNYIPIGPRPARRTVAPANA